jgi:hypothetical protein
MPDGSVLVTLRLPAEHLGRARAFLREVKAADVHYCATASRLLLPVRDRLKRLPGRSIRPQLLIDLERDWHTTLNSPYRVGCRS